MQRRPCWSSLGAMAVPSTSDIQSLGLASSLSAICSWAGIEENTLGPWATALGFPGGSVDGFHARLLATISEADYVEAISTIRILEAPLSLFQKSTLYLAFRAAVHVCTPAPAPVPAPVVSSSVKSKADTRKVKMSNVIDPADESEFVSPAPDQLSQWYAHYKETKQGDPLVSKDPSPDQIQALHVRIVELGLEPYADFSLLTPFGRRMAKALRHRSWMLQEDGTYRPVEVPGPDSYPTWEACWKVYEVILLMLRFTTTAADGTITKQPVVTPIALEAYSEAFGALVRDHPECWHLCQSAEDRCRAEHFPRLARKLASEKGVQPTWSEVFVAASVDDRYWDAEVRRPALGFMARGKRQWSQTDMAERQFVDKVYDNSKGNQGTGDYKSKRALKKEKFLQRTKEFKEAARNAGKHQQVQTKGGGKGGHPRKDASGKFTTTREGKEICFTWAGSTSDQRPDPCCKGRAHVCQHCLQPHRNKAHNWGN